ncbi:hypothetical protein RRG08_052439 [Elysia crispata]|uniref:Uncharacterized protein n=1 Tax=Elysia crispata TaxID=231223 RepID=A0AAE1B199_9GAST|nr:hypothetical protein RRG08_052439 [Elysia crispata]
MLRERHLRNLAREQRVTTPVAETDSDIRGTCNDLMIMSSSRGALSHRHEWPLKGQAEAVLVGFQSVLFLARSPAGRRGPRGPRNSRQIKRRFPHLSLETLITQQLRLAASVILKSPETHQDLCPNTPETSQDDPEVARPSGIALWSGLVGTGDLFNTRL